MSPMLNKSRGVHRGHEHRKEDHPVVERRAVQVMREGAGREKANNDLREGLHAGTLARGIL